jgi:hypothetical protein
LTFTASQRISEACHGPSGCGGHDADAPWANLRRSGAVPVAAPITSDASLRTPASSSSKKHSRIEAQPAEA